MRNLISKSVLVAAFFVFSSFAANEEVRTPITRGDCEACDAAYGQCTGACGEQDIQCKLACYSEYVSCLSECSN